MIIRFIIDVKLASPLAIGNGDSQKTDHDVMLNGNGEFLLPGSTIAGCMRHFLPEQIGNSLFGKITNKSAISSKIKVYDAIVNSETLSAFRDSIAIGKDGQCIDGAKFDFEVIQSGASSTLIVDIKNATDEELSAFDTIINGINIGEIRFGYKSNRGFGLMKIKQVFKLVFDKDNYIDYLKFDFANLGAYKNGDMYIKWQASEISPKYDIFEVPLQLMGGISIRTYSAIDGEADFMHIKDNGEAIIPGTSWNGLFRHVVSAYCDDSIILQNWGGITEDKKAIASKIIFSESHFSNSTDLVSVRTSVDRITGGTINGALFCEVMSVKGSCLLKIMVEKDVSYIIKNLIIVALKDLHLGIETIGGLSAIGRGRMKVKSDTFKINAKEFNICDVDVNLFKEVENV